ncbi:NADP-specific glutamate dehydrogenase [Glaciecola siphonariae]|uniref:Glutamate dehydrogenase n=1 Tax=Glaciecola siphonariae TaxID=521012 RepID=A0ABV9LWD4_9ALTE
MSLQDEIMQTLTTQVGEQSEYLQAVNAACDEIIPVYQANEQYKQHNVLRRLLSPDQVIEFKVEWEDDEHQARVNRGWRIQHSQLLGPYKGGTRFTPSCTESILKFLAFEQSFKNALSGLSLGAGKGGADFDPKNASVNEIRRFCNAYMNQLSRYIGAKTDVPAGDIGVSSTELGWMFGQYLRTNKKYDGQLSGKPVQLAGSELRVQATGFGLIYFLQDVLAHQEQALEGKKLAFSGAGNVAIHGAIKAVERGAKVISLSNSRGTYIDEGGMSADDLKWLKQDGATEKNALASLAQNAKGEYDKHATPWELTFDVALPCATQNEIDESKAQHIVNSGASTLIEGANMPCTSDAQKLLQESGLIYVPGKAANAGGVVLSGFEMQQNADFTYRSADSLDKQLQDTMQSIHRACIDESQRAQETTCNYARSATVAGFRRLADAMVMSGY